VIVSLEDLEPDPSTATDVVFDVCRLAEIDRLAAAEVAHVQPLMEDLLEQTARETHAPVALLNVVLPGAQVVAGQVGVEGWVTESRATPIEWSPCARVVRDGAPLVIPDWAVDSWAATNPLGTIDGIRAYAGVPLRSRSGQVLGALCVLDLQPHDFDEQAMRTLERLASVAAARLEAACVPKDAIPLQRGLDSRETSA
jgi:GAF domain-containing protein